MTPERWQQIKEVFNSALEYEPAQRPSFLSEACDEDAALRQEVESLLAAHERDGSFIDSPAYKWSPDFAMEDPISLQPGQLVGAYEITSFIGRGGMGEVYLAHDQRLRRKVALKLLPLSLKKDESRLSRFEQEARAASALNHPNIIVIYEIFEADATLMMATEFVDGVDLRQLLTAGALSLNEVLNISIQVADALAAAHKAGIIHRDIKPENIMIRPDGYVKVLDFGLAKLSEHESAEAFAEVANQAIRTGSGVVIGTVGYMSPEQARGQTVDARSDIFNLGAVIYEMVAGQKPFRGETPSDTFAAILKTEPPPLSRLALHAPAEMVRIVTKALRKDREERYQAVKELLLDLKSLKEELDFKARLDRSETNEIKTAVSTITHSLRTQVKRNKGRVILATAVLVLLIAAGGFGLYKLLNRTGPQTTPAQRMSKETQVTFSTGLDGFPSLSPDGKSVVYSSDQSGNFEIYVKQLSSAGGELQLTNDGQQNLAPSWSPDGQRIAYHSRKHGGIWVVSALGGAPRQLTDIGARPVWSPDGSSIAFQSTVAGAVSSSRTMPPSIIWTIPSQGGTPKQLTQPGNPSGGHSSPSWSPDGKRVAFDVSDYLSVSIWSIAVDGSDPKKIGPGSQPNYSGDGYVYFMTGDRAETEIGRLRLSATGDLIDKPTTVLQASSGSVFSELAISSDGKRLVYRVDRTVSNLRTVSLSPRGDPVGPSATFASDTSSRNSLPRFSPDGRRIVLNKWRTTMSVDIWVADADGKNLTQLTNNPGVDSQASWLPGEDKLVYLSDRDSDHLRLWTISLITGKQEPLLDLGAGVQFAVLSPDGKQVAYNLARNGIINVWIATLATGERRQLTFDNELAGFPCWSPDGQFIAYEAKRGEDDHVMMIPSGGGQPTQLTNDKGRSWPHSFSPEGDKVAFAGQRDGVWNVYWISIGNKVQKQLTDYTKLNAFVRYPAWAPNQIVYEYAETTGNLWMIEME